MSKITGLTATRALAALSVVFFHAAPKVKFWAPFAVFFAHGYLAVSYFFVLSGFVMTWSYSTKSVGYWHFQSRRVARILPLYWFALASSLSLPAYDYFRHGLTVISNLEIKALLSFGLLQAYFPPFALSLNGPGWSLSVEALFYLLFPILLSLQEKNEKLFNRATLLIFVGSQIIHCSLAQLPMGKSEWWHNLAFYNPWLHLNQFLVGMVGARLLKSGQAPTSASKPEFWAFLTFLSTVYLDPIVSCHNGLLAPLFVMLIISVCSRRIRLLENKALVLLGEMSYGVYILQAPVDAILSRLNQISWHLSNSQLFCVYLIVLLLAAALAYFLVELPCQKFLLRLWEKRRNTALSRPRSGNNRLPESAEHSV